VSRLVACLVAVAAAGCTTLGPEHQRPAVALPAAFPGAAAEAAPAVAADWWTLFGSAELTRLVERAMAANADVAQAVARVELAEAQRREAGGARQPSLAAGASATRAQVGADAPANAARRTVTGNDFRVGLNASWEIDFWGRLARADEAARALLLAGEAARDAVKTSVAALVVQNWIAVRSLDEQAAATRQVLKTREDTLRLVGLRVRAGTASRLEAEQAEILRADAALQLRELSRQRAVAQSALGLLAAEPGLELAEAGLGAAALPPLPPPGLPSALLERRPDVRRAEQALAAATAQIGVARAAMFPTISLTGALGQESSDLADLLKAPARFWSLGVGLALPLFDGGRNAARVDQAGARQREAVAAYQGAIAQAFKDVADALAALRAARESAADAAARADAADRALRLAQARFDAGYAGYLEFLDAQRSATAAQLEALRNRQAQLAASVDLAKALGGGWSP
jgi:multidrug efflux system outer membrane protein